jgi:hypothetical protein
MHDGIVLVDLGATTNVSGPSPFFTITSKLSEPRSVSLAVSDCIAPLNYIGRLSIPTPKGKIEIEKVYLCEGVKGSILSTGRLVVAGWKFAHEGIDAVLISPENITFPLVFNNFCWTIVTSLPTEIKINKISQQPSFDPHIWHVRLGHVSDEVVKKFLRLHFPDRRIEFKPFFCERCAKSKATRLRSNGVESQLPQDNTLDMCVSDVIGPFNLDINGNAYIVTLRDHASTYTFCTSIQTCKHVPRTLIKWITHLKTACGKALSYLRCDNAAKYVNQFRHQLVELGTTLAPVSPYHPEDNGEAERVNRTLGDMARTMLHESRLPKYFWSYAYKTAAYLHNRLPNSRFDTSPLQKLYKRTPSPNSLYLFGCKAIVHVPKEQRRGKLGERAQDCYLLGYPDAGAGWWFWSMTERRMIHSTSAVFPEFQALQVKKKVLKNNLDFLINKVKLILGEEPTEKIAEDKRKAMADLPTDCQRISEQP